MLDCGTMEEEMHNERAIKMRAFSGGG
jgi:hypothetical protein